VEPRKEGNDIYIIM